MNVDFRLTEALVLRHPERAAAVLERLPLDEAVRLLSRFPREATAGVIQRMSPLASASLLERFELARVVEILDALELDACARLARGLSEERRDLVFERLPPRKTRALGALLRFPENSAGALMDPEVQALTEDLTAGEALRQIRQAPHSIHYNVYVVDRSHELVGALNLRELFLAPTKTRLADLMVPNPFHLLAHADRAELVAHPGWKVVHALPVVDDRGNYVGAVRYGTLRALEEELFGRKRADGNTADALGGLFAVGATGILDALTMGVPDDAGGR